MAFNATEAQMPLPATAAASKHKTFLQELLGRELHITVTDGRVFKGSFMCTDKDGSAILHETHEYRGGDKRFVGLVVIPGRHAKKVELVDDDAAYT